MISPYELTVLFRTAGNLELDEMLRELRTFSGALAAVSPKLTGWLLKGNTKQEAFLYEVFDEAGLTSSATAVLRTKLKNEINPRAVSMWNGQDGNEGASLRYFGRLKPEVSLVTLNAEPGAFTDNWKVVANLVLSAVSIWLPANVSVDTGEYYDKKTFKDRPGIGWMLYLPKILTAQQVPEARALLPVMDSNKKQIGTIIVSVTDGAFSDQNPEHVKIANAIEIRLVDQDLLLRNVDI